MFRFERYFAVLKKYIRNRARPEGSIAKGYITEEVIEFCVDYVDELYLIGVPVSQHEGRLIGKGTLGRKLVNATDHATLNKAHLTVLQQSVLVAPYMEEHMYPSKSETWITNHHNDTFATWLQKKVMGNDEIHEQLAWLARGPANSILMYQGYEINGYTFYTKAQDNKSTN